MTNKNLTSVNFVIDGSGSMSGLTDSTIEQFNKFIAEQKLVSGECLMSLTIFNVSANCVYAAKPLAEVPPLTGEIYQPSGGTALYDALGVSMRKAGESFAAMKEEDRPGKVLFVVITDGAENSSREYTKAQITSQIKHQETKYGWDFVFVGANLNSAEEAKTLGFTGGGMNYEASVQGSNDMYKSMSRGISTYRSTGNVGDVTGGKSHVSNSSKSK